MPPDDLLTIGAFSALCGLTVRALRHYDGIGLLAPAEVDPNTGYRRYHRGQVRQARLIRLLREVDMPIDAIRSVLVGEGDGGVRALLVEHRRRLAEQERALADAACALDHYIVKGVHVPAMTGCRLVEVNLEVADLDAARAFYEEAFDVRFHRDQHGDGPVHYHVIFGTWPGDSFFLLNVESPVDGELRRSSFGLLVDDLDAVHRHAVAGGATECAPPQDVAGLPRSSSVIDPSGNAINLYQV
jgi:DNA-binding transcriptional MerR regulator